MTNTPTNATLNIERRGSVVATNIPALVLPARPEIAVTREIPATKAFEIFFADLIDVAEQDFLIRDEKRYKVVGVSPFDTPHAAHTEVVAQGLWGSE